MKPWAWGVLALSVAAMVFLLFMLYSAIGNKPVAEPLSPLARAVFEEDKARVLDLVDHGANANTTMNVTYRIGPGGGTTASIAAPISGKSHPEPGMSVLAYAALQGSNEIMAPLLDKGANVNSVDEYGQTPLILAAWIGDVESVKLLLNRHADVNARDLSGRTALMWARSQGHQSVVDMLKRAGAKE